MIHRGVGPNLHGDSTIQNLVKPGVWNICPWYYHENSLVNVVDDLTRKWFRDFLSHITIWTGACDNAVHRSHRLTVRPLKSTDWPKDHLGLSWPSYPSIPEWMGMMRRGIDPAAQPCYKAVEAHSGYTRVSRSEVSSNCFLATKIVTNAIVGIRSSVAIPSVFRRYFRYRENFLILTANYMLPIGLVRFLLGQWCKAPYSLWLRRAVPLKKFLREVPNLLVIRARLRLADSRRFLELAESGSCTPSADDRSEFYSGGSSDLD